MVIVMVMILSPKFLAILPLLVCVLGGRGLGRSRKKKSVIFSAVTVTTAGWVLFVPDPKPFTKQMLDRQVKGVTSINKISR